MKRIFYTFLIAVLATSCLDLEPRVYSDITLEQLMENADETSGYMLSPIYGQMRWLFEDRSVWGTLSGTLIHMTGLSFGSCSSDQQFASLFLQIPLTVKE